MKIAQQQKTSTQIKIRQQLHNSMLFYVCACSYFKTVAGFCGNRRFNDESSALSAHEAFAVKWTLRRLI